MRRRLWPLVFWAILATALNGGPPVSHPARPEPEGPTATVLSSTPTPAFVVDVERAGISYLFRRAGFGTNATEMDADVKLGLAGAEIEPLVSADVERFLHDPGDII